MNHAGRSRRLAIVTTHPIQYYAPSFRWMAANSSFELKVFYLWNPCVENRYDPGFDQEIQWDLPLLEGYVYEFVENVAKLPGTSRALGIRNPALRSRLDVFSPDAALLIGYRYDSLLRLIFSGQRPFALIFRGDSHRLVGEGKGAKSFIRRNFIRQVFRRFDAVLYAGQANRHYFRLHGVENEKLFFAPHAVDNDRFFAAAKDAGGEGMAWRSELGIPERSVLVLFAGKFEEKKRPLDLLEAFSRLDQTDVALLFVGSGRQEAELRARAAKLPNVFFAPFQNQTKMPRTYAACDLFVLPSFGPQESWGLAVNEAMCLSKAIIVSTHVGCGPDLLRPLENGLIFSAGDIVGLTEALRLALSDLERLRRWGANGQQLMRHYDYGHASRGLEEALEFATHNRRSAGTEARSLI